MSRNPRTLPSRKDNPAEEAITALEHVNRRREGLTGRAREAYDAVQAHNKLVTDLAHCDHSKIAVSFPIENSEDECLPDDQHTLTFDEATGYKLKMLLSILLEPRAYQLELELREAIKNAEA